MLRFLFWIAVIAAAVWFWRKFKSPAAKQQRTSEPDAALMVRCAHCGVHLPQDEALPGRGGVFCGDAHRAAFEKAHPPA